MNNDLISRSALVQSLRNNVLVDVTPKLEQAIAEQPAAYDVDKVLEQLEDCAIVELGITKQQFKMDRVEYSGYCALSLSEAKQIVKSGGIE